MNNKEPQGFRAGWYAELFSRVCFQAYNSSINTLLVDLAGGTSDGPGFNQS